jgi:tetratricopeptide (TPR) repeat protein
VPARRFTLPKAFAVLALCGLPACTGELAVFAALAFSMSFGAWLVGRSRARASLYQAEAMRLAIASGNHRGFEDHLRKELALAAAGEAVSTERQWLARAQLGGLLVAEWRLDEAKDVYQTDEVLSSPNLAALAAFGRHELAVLTDTPDEERLAEIRRDRDECLHHVPQAFRADVERAWHAVEGLCLVRMGRAREGVPLLEAGVKALEYNPALVVYLFHLGQAYEHIGERKLAASTYEDAMNAFPGTRLASEARARVRALAPGASEGMFRHMLPEPPSASPQTALARTREPDDE